LVFGFKKEGKEAAIRIESAFSAIQF